MGCGGTIQLTGSGAAETGTGRSAGGQARAVSGQAGVHALGTAQASGEIVRGEHLYTAV